MQRSTSWRSSSRAEKTPACTRGSCTTSRSRRPCRASQQIEQARGQIPDRHHAEARTEGLAAIDKVVKEELANSHERADHRLVSCSGSRIRSRQAFSTALPACSAKRTSSTSTTIWQALRTTFSRMQRDTSVSRALTSSASQRKYLGKPKVVLTVVPEGKTEMMLTANGGAR